MGSLDGWFPWRPGAARRLPAYGVYAGPLLAAVRAFDPAAAGGTGLGWTALVRALRAGRLSVVWLPDRAYYLEDRSLALSTGTWASWNGAAVRFAYDEHTQVLLGFDGANLIVGNVDYARHGEPFLNVWPLAEFAEAYAVLEQMAIVF